MLQALKLGIVGVFTCCASGFSIHAQDSLEPPSVQRASSLAIGVQDGVAMDFEVVVADDAGNVNVVTSSGSMGLLGMGGDVLVSPGLGFGGDALSLINNSAVQKDLDLSDDQMDQLRRLREDYQQRIRDHVRSIREGNITPDGARDMGEVLRRIQQQQKADLEQILMPHQMRRLQEISVQVRLRQQGPTGMLSDKALAEELGITDEQMKRLRARAKEIGEELQAKMEKLREEARRELLAELTQDQLDRLERMMGEQFSFPKEAEAHSGALRIKRPDSNRDR